MKFLFPLLLFFPCFWARAQGQWKVIESNALSREVRYTTRATDPAADHLVYLTDGQKLLDDSWWAAIDSLTSGGEIPAARYVFVSSIDDAGTDHRIFLSTGKLDAEGHDFNNWRGQLKDLLCFLETEPQKSAMYYPSIPATEYDRNIAWYADQAPAGTSLEDILATSRQNMIDFIEAIPEGKIDYAYGRGKWTIGEVLHHVMYYEHIMRESAQLIAGTTSGPLEYQRYTQSSTAKPGKGMTKSELLSRCLEARDLTEAALAFMTDEEKRKVGRHEGFRTSARVLALCIAGHQVHHFGVLKERY